MKRILYLHAGAELYGADIVLLELVKGLDKNEYYPIVVLPNDGPLVEKLKEKNIEVIIEKYPILRRKYFNLKGIINYCYEYLKCSKKIVKIVKDKKIDIIHINTAAVLEGCYIKKATNKKMIWHIHEILLKPKIVSTFIYKMIAKYSDEIVCVSNAVKEHFEQITKRKGIKVIYNGVDNKKFNCDNDSLYLKKEFGIKDNEIVIGMIGRINAWKGQNDFLEAVNKVFDRVSNSKAILVGGVFEGQEWRIEDLKKKIENSKYSDRIILSDFRSDINNIHNLIDIFVLPSTNPDPLPTVVLEAMASGKTIVAYRHGGVCEMVKENYNGLFAEVGNVDELANQIVELANNEELRKNMGKNSMIRQRENFSLDSYVKNFERIYK